MSAEVVFWIAFLLLVYTYVGYPLLIWILATVRERRCQRALHLPTVSVVVTAYNEASRIHKRLENLLDMDYPADRLEIVVVLDGPKDGTEKVVAPFVEKGVRICHYAQNRGKAYALNVGVANAKNEVVVFADARQRFDRNAIKELVQAFVDPTVGGVTGELVLLDHEDNGQPVDIGGYWKYEKMIRQWESRYDSTVGATGAIFAIRRGLYRELSPGTILDDVVTPMRLTKAGYRVVFERRAIAYDAKSGTAPEEYARKVRTLVGNYDLMQREPWINNPLKNRLWLQWWSHKVLRLAGPFLLVAMLVASFLSQQPFFGYIAAIQLLAYVAALAGFVWMKFGPVNTVISLCTTFLVLNVSAAHAFIAFVAGRSGKIWRSH